MIGIHMKCVDEALQIWRAGGGLDRIDAVRDGGAELTVDRDVADMKALRTALVQRGHVVTCTALGLVRLGWPPVFPLTVDGDGRGIGLHRHRVDQIAGCMIGSTWLAEMAAAGLIKGARSAA